MLEYETEVFGIFPIADLDRYMLCKFLFDRFDIARLLLFIAELLLFWNPRLLVVPLLRTILNFS